MVLVRLLRLHRPRQGAAPGRVRQMDVARLARALRRAWDRRGAATRPASRCAPI